MSRHKKVEGLDVSLQYGYCGYWPMNGLDLPCRCARCNHKYTARHFFRWVHGKDPRVAVLHLYCQLCRCVLATPTYGPEECWPVYGDPLQRGKWRWGWQVGDDDVVPAESYPISLSSLADDDWYLEQIRPTI